MFVTDQRLLLSKLVRLRIDPCKIYWTHPKASLVLSTYVSILVLSTYVSNCHPHSTLSSCQPLIEGVKVTHMWKTARDGPLHLSNYLPANSPYPPSLPPSAPSLPAPSGVDLDYLPPNDLTRPQLWKNLSKILLKTLDCQLHGQLQCCYLNLKLILQPWPQIVQRISRASSKFLTIWTSE